MTFGDFYDYCMAKKGAEETFPFGEQTLVFKLKGKMFALADIEARPLSMNLKCEPQRAVELRKRYAGVRPGYHMNKKHWNTITADEKIPDQEIRGWIDESYRLVVQGLTRKEREALIST